MQLQTILNKVRKFKGYVYENVTLSQDGKRLDVHIRPRKGASPTCSGCGRKGPVYDHLPKARRFEFVPLWQIAVFFVYVMRRVDCRHCKRIVVEQFPWSDGKHPDGCFGSAGASPSRVRVSLSDSRRFGLLSATSRIGDSLSPIICDHPAFTQSLLDSKSHTGHTLIMIFYSFSDSTELIKLALSGRVPVVRSLKVIARFRHGIEYSIP